MSTKSRLALLPAALVVLAACSSSREEAVRTNEDEVTVARDQPLMQDLFCPQQPVTRRDMAYFLERMKRGTAFNPPGASNLFDDVRHGSSDERWIEQLFVDGITKGCGERAYCPDDEVPREQMAAFIIRLTHGPDFQREGTGRFSDVVDGSKIFEGYIEQLADDGITKGCDQGRFCPREKVTREQMAAFLMRALHPGSPDGPGSNKFGDSRKGSPDLAGRAEQAVAEGIMEPCARAEPQVGINTDPNRECKFLCDATAIAACASMIETGYGAALCVLAADRYLCNDLCTAGNWKQLCYVSNPDNGCVTCCQDIYGCNTQCAWGPY